MTAAGVAAGMADILPWIATAATVTAAFMTAANLGARITGYGFIVFLAGSLCWLAIGISTNQPALLWTNVVLTILNLFGIWRWLGRQAKVEEGTQTAAETSESMPGEALFPASLLTRAPLAGPRGPVATCVDAMIGAQSGRIAYVGVSAGGMAGVGETLHRVPFAQVSVRENQLHFAAGAPALAELESFEKDEWPAR